MPLRLALGAVFLAHARAKWERGPAGFARLLAQMYVPFPEATTWASMLLELVGGIAMIVSVCVALFSLPVIATMLVAMLTAQWPYRFNSVVTIGLTASGPVFGPPG